MGILKEPADFVVELKLPKGFSVCELGNQMMAGGRMGVPAEPFYQRLGCGRYESIDANGLGTVTADLNRPLSCALGPFDLVTDFGTGEHIFDQAQVWRTMHDLTAPGGHIAFDRPVSGYTQHCFYLINECLIQDLAAANDYQIVRLERGRMPRGVLLRGVFRRPMTERAFRIPQQGRYTASLRLKGTA